MLITTVLTGTYLGLFCLLTAIAVQALFVWAGARFFGLDCRFREAAVISMICALLLVIPWIGIFISCVGFFVIFMKWLRANWVEALVTFLVSFTMEFLAIACFILKFDKGSH